MEEQEDAMLDSTAAERTANSRLSCRLTINDALDSIVLRALDRQQAPHSSAPCL
jgi:ferredoxin